MCLLHIVILIIWMCIFLCNVLSLRDHDNKRTDIVILTHKGPNAVKNPGWDVDRLPFSAVYCPFWQTFCDSLLVHKFSALTLWNVNWKHLKWRVVWSSSLLKFLHQGSSTNSYYSFNICLILTVLVYRCSMLLLYLDT